MLHMFDVVPAKTTTKDTNTFRFEKAITILPVLLKAIGVIL
jgi:hypothetical protein